MKRVSQVIEDMLKMYLIDKLSKWEEYLHLVEFAYNNRYQVYLKVSLFKALYGKKCNTPLSWDSPIDRAIIGPEFLREMEEQVTQIKHNLKVFLDRQKSYADKNRENKEFKVGNHVFLIMKERKISLKLGSYEKLRMRYCGLFEILERISPVDIGFYYKHLCTYIMYFMFIFLKIMFLMLTM